MVEYLTSLNEAIRSTNWAQIDNLSQTLGRVRTEGHTLFVGGNGGSHAVAIHWGVDLPKVARIDTITLGANPSLMTALANDLDYQVGLSTELTLRARQGDVFVALSCSGRSNNIVAAIKGARKLWMPTFLITGMTAPEYPEVCVIRIMSDNYGVLEDVFSAIGHQLAQDLST